MPLLSKASNVVQNIFFLYDVTGFTQIGHSIPVANCTRPRHEKYPEPRTAFSSFIDVRLVRKKNQFPDKTKLGKRAGTSTQEGHVEPTTRRAS